MKHFQSNLDQILNNARKANEIPGLAVGVTDSRNLIYSSTIGVRNIETREPLQTTHVFHMASVSKPFVSTAVLQLAEQGRINLEQTVTSILPYFKMKDDRYKKMALLQILNHTSGMPDEEDYEWYKPQYDDGAAERYVRGLATKTLIAEPGEKFAYSNIAFDLLGDVISKVSGITFETYVKQNILEPLQMEESDFLIESIRKDLTVSPHVWNGKVIVGKHYPYNRRHAPSSTLNSNIFEMANWIIANLNHGEFKGVQILKKESHTRSWKPSVTIDARRKMGFSWFLEAHQGTQVISHSGRDTGFSSHVALLPEKQLGFVVMCNYDRASPDPLDGLVTEILDLLTKDNLNSGIRE